MSQEQMLRNIANLVAQRRHVPMNADCPRCQERETLLDCIAVLLSNAGLQTKWMRSNLYFDGSELKVVP